MTGSEIIKGLMEKEDVTNVQLANRLGITQATMWARLNNKSAAGMQIAVFAEMLDALGYEMVLKKRKEVVEEEPEIPVQIDAPTKQSLRGNWRAERREKVDTTPGEE